MRRVVKLLVRLGVLGVLGASGCGPAPPSRAPEHERAERERAERERAERERAERDYARCMDLAARCNESGEKCEKPPR